MRDTQRPADASESNRRPVSGCEPQNAAGTDELRDDAGRPVQRPVQTLARAYDEIRAGTEPWVALNEFFHEWFDYSRDRREALVAEPIRFAEGDAGAKGDEPRRWAAFCAAAADELCARAGMPHPKWVDDPVCTLAEPWYGFGDPGARAPEVRAHLKRVTPERLGRRNILGGDRVFANKYELEQRHRR